MGYDNCGDGCCMGGLGGRGMDGDDGWGFGNAKGTWVNHGYMNDGGWACWGNGYSDLVWKGYAFRNGQMAYSADKGNVSRKKKTRRPFEPECGVAFRNERCKNRRS